MKEVGEFTTETAEYTEFVKKIAQKTLSSYPVSVSSLLLSLKIYAACANCSGPKTPDSATLHPGYELVRGEHLSF
jgi:hypothetical protein